jgi:Sulfotransferase domain
MSDQGSIAFVAGTYQNAGAEALSVRPGAACAAPLPSFVVVGPPRTGTTWMHEVLSRHTHLPDPTKETHFFDLHFERGLSWYLDHFPAAIPGRLRGEIAPTYFASAVARERIAQVLPHAKLVFIFRHPVARLVSLYRVKRAYGMFEWSLEQAIERDPELLESSRYATHLTQWLSAFPSQQISINLYDDLSNDPQAFIDGIVDFLGVERFRLSSRQMQQVFSTGQLTEPRNYRATRMATTLADWCKARKLDSVVAGVRNSSLMRFFVGSGAPFAEIPAPVMRRIADHVRPEIDDLEALLDRDLSGWKTLPAS